MSRGFPCLGNHNCRRDQVQAGAGMPMSRLRHVCLNKAQAHIRARSMGRKAEMGHGEGGCI